MIRCLLSRSGKEEYQTMVVMAVGLRLLNTTGINLMDGKQYSTKETTTVIHLIDMTRVNTTILCLL